MFEFYKRGNPDRDIALKKKLNPGLQEFKEWVQENKEMLSKSFDSIEIQSKWVAKQEVSTMSFVCHRHKTVPFRMLSSYTKIKF